MTDELSKHSMYLRFKGVSGAIVQCEVYHPELLLGYDFNLLSLRKHIEKKLRKRMLETLFMIEKEAEKK